MTRALKRVIARIEDADPGLGAHLSAAVRTGHFCVYDPPARDHVTWRVDRRA